MAKKTTKTKEVDEPIVDTIEPAETVEPIETPEVEDTIPDFVKGIVSNCSKLNVRKAPDKKSEVVCVANAGDELQIDMTVASIGWCKVITKEGKEGYCMAEYVQYKK